MNENESGNVSTDGGDWREILKRVLDEYGATAENA
jgi:hypothetical protein